MAYFKLHLAVVFVLLTTVGPLLFGLSSYEYPGILKSPSEYPSSALGLPWGLVATGVAVGYFSTPILLAFAFYTWDFMRMRPSDVDRVPGCSFWGWLIVIWIITLVAGLMLADGLTGNFDPVSEPWKLVFGILLTSPLSVAGMLVLAIAYPVSIGKLILKREIGMIKL